MAKFDGILLCSDFDGTLFCNDDISKENSKAIKYFQDNGGLFTIASGRFPDDFSKFYDRFIPNTYIIGLNGAVIFDGTTGKRIYSSTMQKCSQSIAEKIFIENTEINKLMLFSFDKFYSFTRITWLGDTIVDELTKVAFIIDEKDSDDMTGRITKSVDPLKFSVTRSWSTYIEMMNIENTKGRAVRRLKKLLGNRVEKMICVGDYENDISMIREADIGYAVGNATQVVKASADRITVPFDQHAIERIISEL